MATKKKFVQYVSPAGTAIYPWLNTPDTKFNADGEYSVKLSFNKADAKRISDVVKPLMNGGKHNPLKPEEDDQGNKTGNYVANFKMKARVKPKNGQEFTQSPILLDSNGNRTDAKVGGGSKLQVAYEAVPYDAMGGGVTLRLKKVRILELVEYGEKDNTDWGSEEGSYTAPKSEEQKDWEADEGIEEDEDEEDF